jgi:hypothetical protein
VGKLNDVRRGRKGIRQRDVWFRFWRRVKRREGRNSEIARKGKILKKIYKI